MTEYVERVKTYKVDYQKKKSRILKVSCKKFGSCEPLKQIKHTP